MAKTNYQFYVILNVLLFMHIGVLSAQTEYTINGKLLDENEQPVMFANIALLNGSDSSIVAGTISLETGKFELQHNTTKGSYLISASCIGFMPFQERIKLSDKQSVDLGTVILPSRQTELQEVVIKQERLKAKQQVNKTTYYANSAMKTASNTGVDMAQYIPGVKVDLMQNISLNGSQDIVILVNGIERDGAFLAQLNSDKIDKIEIQNSPGVDYDAEASGVINVILKKNETGISGHLYANIPTDLNEVFSFPTASLNYALDKLTLYTSYNGGFSFFDIKTEDERVFPSANNVSEIIKKENLYQQNWSHKLHFGADYFFNENNQLNVYGFFSRFSNEQSGNFSISETHNGLENHFTNFEKDDNDINSSAYASVYYKHLFAKNTELTFDVSYYLLESENKLHLSGVNSQIEQVSHSQPRNNLLKARLNLRFPINNFFVGKAGFEQSLNHSNDDLMPEFIYSESTSAAFISSNYTRKNLQVNTGIRAEYFQYGNNDSKKNRIMALPALHLKYRISDGSNLRFSYKKRIVRPYISQLNPNIQTIDLYTSKKGNPELTPELHHKYNLDYSFSFGNNFLNTGLFYTRKRNVIESLTLLSEEIFLKKEIHNLGSLHQLGINTSGSFKLHERISLNPHIRFYRTQTQGNNLARTHQIADKQAFNFESALSAVFLMKNDFALSVSAQYDSPSTRIQHNYREDALYFVSFEKTFFNQLKLGITSAVPFKKEFTYQGTEITGQNFRQTARDNIQMSLFPVWFKISYSFSSGKKAKRIERENSFEENRPQKGF